MNKTGKALYHKVMLLNVNLASNQLTFTLILEKRQKTYKLS